MVTPSGGRWSGDASRQSRRRAILHAAAALFTEAGYDCASMDAVALAAGVSKATVYAHFHDKAGLYEAVMEHWLEQLPMPALDLHEGAGLREHLAQVMRELKRQATHPAALAIATTLGRSAHAPTPKRFERWLQRHAPYQRHVEELLARHCDCEMPALAARQFMLLAGSSIEAEASGACDEEKVALDAFLRAYPCMEP